MKNKSKWLALLTTLLCLLPLVAGGLSGGDKVYASDSVNVTLHKKKMDEFPANSIENTGKEMTEFDRYEGLPGVTFTAWEISKDFYAALNAKLTGNESDDDYKKAVKQVMEDFVLNKSTATKISGDKTTDGNGDAVFSDLSSRNEDGTYKVYYFEEHVTPGIEAGSYKLILMLPLKDENGTENTDVHLYPKNKVDSDVPEKEVVDDDGNTLQPNADGVYDFEVGQKIHYKASFTIPNQIGDILPTGVPRYSKLDFADAVDQKYVKFESLDDIEIEGVVIDQTEFLSHAIYTPVNQTDPFDKNAGFTISMKLNGTAGATAANYLNDYAGKKITFNYTVSFTEKTAIDLGINNKFTVTMNHDGGQDTSKSNEPIDPIITGGKKFIKHEENNSGDGLKGAEFVVLKEVNGEEFYLTAAAESMTWTKVETDEDYADATKYTSGDKGIFEVTGLEYGDYKLRETKAPNGYVKLSNDQTTAFTVNKGSYTSMAAIDIANTAKGGVLPSTGGKGILAFIVIGLSLMVAAIIRYRRVQIKV